jgi:hypothetical protein
VLSIFLQKKNKYIDQIPTVPYQMGRKVYLAIKSPNSASVGFSDDVAAEGGLGGLVRSKPNAFCRAACAASFLACFLLEPVPSKQADPQ